MAKVLSKYKKLDPSASLPAPAKPAAAPAAVIPKPTAKPAAKPTSVKAAEQPK
jgi:hypothetical protein